MKKYLITVLTLLIVLAVQSAGIVAAAGSLTLVGVSQTEKGPVFTFRVSGKFSKSELKGSVHVENGGDYKLHCTQVDDDTIKCNASEKVSGVNVSVSFGGSTFWTYVPEAPASTSSPSSSSSSQYCYSIWDYWEFTDGEWADFGPHCQDTPAEHGDEILYTVPDPGGSFEAPVWFIEEDMPEYCDIPNYGPAYYYTPCFGGF
jgi:hypothetical protein